MEAEESFSFLFLSFPSIPFLYSQLLALGGEENGEYEWQGALISFSIGDYVGDGGDGDGDGDDDGETFGGAGGSVCGDCGVLLLLRLLLLLLLLPPAMRLLY
ncbi:hypothetical protein HOY82DRAFT_560617 [Tuber indicum]|nr:hypothetical protein HOY82DRAFT_560617 [Tuber indicum]